MKLQNMFLVWSIEYADRAMRITQDESYIHMLIKTTIRKVYLNDGSKF
jgi:hypothetical protein